MKLNNHSYRTVALLLLVMLAAACTREDDFAAPGDNGTAPPAPLTITVADAAYAPAETSDANEPATRAVEREYGKEFTYQDQIGLYVVEDGKIVISNLRLYLTRDNWVLSDGSSPELYYVPGGTYYAYYPWQSDEYMADKVDVGNDDFFAPLVTSWSPKEDQSNYTDYTASDLMTATGTCAPEANTGDYKLDFMMSHRMALAIMKITTVKEYTGATSDGKISYHAQAGLPWLNAYYCSGGYRYLVNTETTKAPMAMKLRYAGEQSERNFSIQHENLQSGKYRTFNVQNVRKPASGVRPMEDGDYYMEDGTIVPGDAFAIPEGCIGVVIDLYNLTNDDPVLKEDHPDCTHGVVIALKDAGSAQWSSVNDDVNTWTISDKPGDKLKNINIRDNIRRKGYANTMVLKAYNSAFPGKKVQPVEIACSYKETVKPPVNSSGWYCPSKVETEYIAFWIDRQIKRAGGEPFRRIWSSTEFDNSNSWSCEATCQRTLKTEECSVRAALAF